MTTTRVYQASMTLEKTLRILQEGSGSQLDDSLVCPMLKLGQAGILSEIISHSFLEHSRGRLSTEGSRFDKSVPTLHRVFVTARLAANQL